jgi:hypothetical protein
LPVIFLWISLKATKDQLNAIQSVWFQHLQILGDFPPEDNFTPCAISPYSVNFGVVKLMREE